MTTDEKRDPRIDPIKGDMLYESGGTRTMYDSTDRIEVMSATEFFSKHLSDILEVLINVGKKAAFKKAEGLIYDFNLGVDLILEESIDEMLDEMMAAYRETDKTYVVREPGRSAWSEESSLAAAKESLESARWAGLHKAMIVVAVDFGGKLLSIEFHVRGGGND